MFKLLVNLIIMHNVIDGYQAPKDWAVYHYDAATNTVTIKDCYIRPLRPGEFKGGAFAKIGTLPPVVNEWGEVCP